MNWQPIETAPKDGTLVLLRNAEHAPMQALGWNRQTKRWEGKAFTALGVRRVVWDEESAPPTEWRAA